jgi:hypothetical protein
MAEIMKCKIHIETSVISYLTERRSKTINCVVLMSDALFSLLYVVRQWFGKRRCWVARYPFPNKRPANDAPVGILPYSFL